MDENQKPDYSKFTPEFMDKLQEIEQKKPEFKQLRLLGDIADMVQELISVADSSSKDSKDTLQKLGAVLTDSHSQLVALNSKEVGETPDYATPIVNAVDELKTAITAEISKIDVKPNVNVDAPTVTVSPTDVTVDLTKIEKLIKNDLPKAFSQAISLVPTPEPTDTSGIVEALATMNEWLESIDHQVHFHPTFPNTMKVTNPNNTEVGNTLGVPTHNNGTVTYPDTVTDVFTFKQNTTVVGTVTIVYSDSTKVSMVSWSLT